MVGALLEALGNEDALELASRYLAFIWYAFNQETGRFSNFMDYHRRWLEVVGSDDSQGRTLWLWARYWADPTPRPCKTWPARYSSRPCPPSSARPARGLGLRAHRHPRIPPEVFGDRRAGQVREELAGRLLALYQKNRTEDWRWFETG